MFLRFSAYVLPLVFLLLFFLSRLVLRFAAMSDSNRLGWGKSYLLSIFRGLVFLAMMYAMAGISWLIPFPILDRLFLPYEYASVTAQRIPIIHYFFPVFTTE